MSLEPIARGPLRATDLGIAHLFGNFSSQLRRVLVAAHRRDVEPLVRLHQINCDARPRGVDHAKAEAIFSVRRFGAPRRHFHARHFDFPFFLPLRLKTPGTTSPCCSADAVEHRDLRDKI